MIFKTSAFLFLKQYLKLVLKFTLFSQEALVGTGENVEKWEIDEMMHDGDKNQDGFLDYEGLKLTIS